MREALDASLIWPGLRWTFERCPRQDGAISMQEVERDYLTNLPDRERERLRRVAGLEDHRADASHPRTADRLAVLAQRPQLSGAVSPSSIDWRRIDAELDAASPRVDQAIRRRYARAT
jgi:hypothetical protein